MTPLLQVKQLSKKYSGQTIFSGLSFSIFNKQKIGIIGRNGAGKSTLFRIILGQEEADDGVITFGSEARVGYIQQNNDFLATESGLTYLMRQSGEEEWKCRKVASRFRFNDEQLNKEAASLSSGWQMRLKLSAMLVLEPNLFLLDEPTNYLDLGTILLLEEFLKTYNGAFLIISHDREFLKNTCRETMEITPNRCIHFPQALEAYLAYKEQRAQSEQKLNEKINKEQKHLEVFVNRFRYKASKASQAQAFIKKIDKLESHKISIEHNASTVKINIPNIEKRKNKTLVLDNLVIGYNQQPLVSGFDLAIKSGEKVIILGDNGQGKSTFLKTITDEIPPVEGSYSWFTGLKKAYYSQSSLLAVDSDEQVGDYLRRVASSDLKTEKILQMAGDFLFSGESLKKPISVLSGGEKSRMILAGLLLGKPDVLILDEAANHLDFETVEALALALQEFNGTILFTSHDRTFAKIVSDNMIEINNGVAKRYYGEYEDYITRLEKRLEIKEETLTSEKKDQETNNYLLRKEQQKIVKSLEMKLEKLEKNRKDLHQYFLENPLKVDQAKVNELNDLEQEIRSLEDKYLELI